MKKNIFFGLLLIIVTATFGQQKKPSSALTKQDYLEKSASLSRTAWLLLGGGAGVLAGTLLISGTRGVCIGPGCTKRSFPVIPVAIGGAMMVSSVPLFIASGRNKRKGMSLSFKNEPAFQIQNNGFVNQPVPSLTFTIRL
ncbi:MAG: hypothetical protein H7Y01_13515 [Ferruginibacter sp.]|nr:hypothetical protein [Chitinophagaceae bacterium]